MINDRSVLALVTARGGSKSIPKKNLALLGGKPLVAWTIETALGSAYIDRLIISSDSKAIIDVAVEWGCEAPFVRPAELAGDEAPSIAAVHHALEALEERYDYVVLLQPTSPFRSFADIDDALTRCERKGAPACVSLAEVSKPPDWMYRLKGDGRIDPLSGSFQRIPRRQDLPPVYALNGAIFIARTGWIAAREDFIAPETVGYVMPAERSIDIDTVTDLAIAEAMLAR